MSKAWVFQDPRQKAKHGTDKCPWSVGWLDPDGKRVSKKIGSHTAALKFAGSLENKLREGTYEAIKKVKWKVFREKYENDILPGFRPGTRTVVKGVLDRFETAVKPGRVATIRTTTIDKFIAYRRDEDEVSEATINKDLRHLRAVLAVAKDWDYLAILPKFRKQTEKKKLIRYVTPEDFAKLYKACDKVARPASDVYTVADWWRALLVFAYMTGWRISEIIALKWDDVSLDRGEAITRADDNKGGRDESVLLHPIVVDHLRKLTDLVPLVFWWPHHERTLWTDFQAIQKAAGIPEPYYGFHDLRRAFATQNAKRLSADALQGLMRHKSYLTTKKYINMAEQVNKAAENLFVPDCLKVEAEEEKS